MNDEELKKFDEEFIASMVRDITQGPDKDIYLKGITRDLRALECNDYSGIEDDVKYFVKARMNDPRDRQLTLEIARRAGVSVECPVSQYIPSAPGPNGRKNGIG